MESNCGACGRRIVLPRATTPTMYRCSYCGVPHYVMDGQTPTAISPPLASIATPGRVSPWFGREYKPYIIGVFECEFDKGLCLRLQWDGNAWTWLGQVVDMSTFIKWRGVWL